MKIAAFDLETSGLEGDWGCILCASFCPITDEATIGEAYTLTRNVRPKDPMDDGSLAKKIKAEIEKYNLIVGWNSKLFDIPFLNSRLLNAGLTSCYPQMHLDVMWYASGSSARLASRKLDNVSKFFKTKTRKYEVQNDVLQAARYGDEKALAEVIKHCEADVQITSEVYWRLLPGIRNIHRGG
jgi:uncharacterized protein YprB with RNaseH-like and TPR domain